MELFDVEIMDARPFVYHRCEDGCMAAHDNPNLIRPPRQWYSPDPTKPNRTFWQDWQHFEAVRSMFYDE